MLIFTERRLPSTSLPNQTEKRLTTEKVLSTLANEIARDSIGNVVRKTQSASSSPNISMFNSVPSSSTTLTYKLGKHLVSIKFAYQIVYDIYSCLLYCLKEYLCLYSLIQSHIWKHLPWLHSESIFLGYILKASSLVTFWKHLPWLQFKCIFLGYILKASSLVTFWKDLPWLHSESIFLGYIFYALFACKIYL